MMCGLQLFIKVSPGKEQSAQTRYWKIVTHLAAAFPGFVFNEPEELEEWLAVRQMTPQVLLWLQQARAAGLLEEFYYHESSEEYEGDDDE